MSKRRSPQTIPGMIAQIFSTLVGLYLMILGGWVGFAEGHYAEGAFLLISYQIITKSIDTDD